jgi:nicotinamidase-related amidase
MAEVSLRVRYYRHTVDPGVEYVESSFQHVFQDWTLKTEETGLVMVDCWDIHPIESHLARTDQICQERIAPVAEACRQAAVAVIHAPSPPTAKRYAQWVRYASDAELFGAEAEPVPWPPEELRKHEGEYQQFAKPPEPALDQWREKYMNDRKIVPCLEPQPDDFVIATGDQLHRLCRHRGIVHLLYCGFAANMCVPGRDYGTRAMNQRGYNIILLRDCTTAIEAHSTLDAFGLTEAAIMETEMLLGHTATSDDLLAACENAVQA